MQAAELIREDEDYLQQLAALPHETGARPEPPSLDIAALGPRPLARRAIAEFLHRHGAQVTARTLAASIALIDDWHGQGAVSVGNRLELARQTGKLVLLHS